MTQKRYEEIDNVQNDYTRSEVFFDMANEEAENEPYERMQHEKQVRKRKTAIASILVTVFIVAGGLGVGVYKLIDGIQGPNEPFPVIRDPVITNQDLTIKLDGNTKQELNGLTYYIDESLLNHFYYINDEGDYASYDLMNDWIEYPNITLYYFDAYRYDREAFKNQKNIDDEVEFFYSLDDDEELYYQSYTTVEYHDRTCLDIEYSYVNDGEYNYLQAGDTHVKYIVIPVKEKELVIEYTYDDAYQYQIDLDAFINHMDLSDLD